MQLHSLRTVVIFAAATLAATASTARAELIFTVRETPTGVALTGSGTLNITGLTSSGSNGFMAFMNPSNGSVLSGVNSRGLIFPLTGGPTFGLFNPAPASSTSGPIVGISTSGVPRLVVPEGYVSGSPLTTSAFWSGATFSSLRITPGVYVWTWGSGPTADRLVLDIPAPASVSLLAGAGVLAMRRRR